MTNQTYNYSPSQRPNHYPTTNISGPGVTSNHQPAIDALLLQTKKALMLTKPQYPYLSDHSDYTCLMQGYCNCNNNTITIYNDSFAVV
jgi:hypothetical protein